MRTRLIVLALCGGLGCTSGSRDPGLRAQLHVSDGVFVPGAFPEAEDGPGVVSLHVPHSQVLPAQRAESVSGALEPSATAVAIGLAGDVGYYIVVAGAPAIDEPDYPSFNSALTFSAGVRGPLTLRVAAADEQGHFGPADEVALSALTAAVDGALVVRLRWDTEADLDLHLLTPSGDEVWARNVNSYTPPAPGAPAGDPTAYLAGGLFGFDSNAGCVIDGRREENITYTKAAPSGRYRVRVTTASLCSEVVAHYRVEVFVAGSRIGRADGVATSYDARAGQGAGDGALATTFVLP